MTTLIFITSSYPFRDATEPSFIRPEVEALCREFDRVIFAPLVVRDECDSIPSNASVSLALAGRLPLWKRVMGLVSVDTLKNLFADRARLHSLKDVRGSMATSIYIRHYKRCLRQLMDSMSISTEDTLVYNFWFTAPAIASAMMPGVRSVSRAHGHDIYSKQGVFLSHPRRDTALKRMLKIYVASDAGASHLRKHYPANASKITTARLGCREPEGLNPHSDNINEVTLLCVARTEPVKRIPLMFELLKSWSASRPDLRVRWIYVGDGSEMSQLKEAISHHCPSNLTIELLGAISNNEVHHLLATRHFDAALLTSSSEGGAPIALNEAISYGVPVIATNVGGIPEIVTPEVGALLSPAPTAKEFIEVMNRELPLLPQKREAARRLWGSRFRASVLRTEFAKELRNFLPS